VNAIRVRRHLYGIALVDGSFIAFVLGWVALDKWRHRNDFTPKR